MGNNPMVGATVAVAVSVEEAAKAGKFQEELVRLRIWGLLEKSKSPRFLIKFDLVFYLTAIVASTFGIQIQITSEQ